MPHVSMDALRVETSDRVVVLLATDFRHRVVRDVGRARVEAAPAVEQECVVKVAVVGHAEHDQRQVVVAALAFETDEVPGAAGADDVGAVGVDAERQVVVPAAALDVDVEREVGADVAVGNAGDRCDVGVGGDDDVDGVVAVLAVDGDLDVGEFSGRDDGSGGGDIRWGGVPEWRGGDGDVDLVVARAAVDVQVEVDVTAFVVRAVAAVEVAAGAEGLAERRVEDVDVDVDVVVARPAVDVDLEVFLVPAAAVVAVGAVGETDDPAEGVDDDGLKGDIVVVVSAVDFDVDVAVAVAAVGTGSAAAAAVTDGRRDRIVEVDDEDLGVNLV